MKKETMAYVILFFVAAIWGGGYIASEQALTNGWSVFSILFQRNLIGFIVTFLFCFKKKFWKNKRTLIIGSIAGVLYFAGFAFQLLGQNLTTVANTGLLSSLGIILVPIFYWIIFKKKPPIYSFVACAVGLIGAFILAYQPGLQFHFGDILVVIGAIAYAVHLTFIGKEGDDIDLASLMCVQFGVMAILSAGGIGISGSDFVGEPIGWIGVLYYALLSGLIGIAGQFYAQRIIDSYKVSLILTLEGLFSAVFSVIILGETVTTQLLIGGFVMCIAAVYTQICDIIVNQNKQEGA